MTNNQPIQTELTAGQTYYLCQCNKSSNAPFCDGSHVGTEFEPSAYKAETTGTAYICQCHHSDNKPFCDGSHSKV